MSKLAADRRKVPAGGGEFPFHALAVRRLGYYNPKSDFPFCLVSRTLAGAEGLLL